MHLKLKLIKNLFKKYQIAKVLFKCEYNKTMNKRLIAIGDIHGEIDKLNSLLDKISPKKSDTLVFLGDYIDRGNSSKEVISTLIKFKKSTNCIFLMGNHEDMLLRTKETRKEEDISFWLFNGGITTLDSYGDYVNTFKTHGNFFENLKLYYSTDKFLFVHAGIRPDKPLDEQEKQDFLWIRDNFINHKHQLKQKVIFGHTIFDEPHIEEDKIGINTGCGIDEDGYLTAYICNENEFIRSD